MMLLSWLFADGNIVCDDDDAMPSKVSKQWICTIAPITFEFAAGLPIMVEAIHITTFLALNPAHGLP